MSDAEPMDSAAVWLAYTTVGNEADAQALAHRLVQEQLARCVTLLPGARSVYVWQGQLETTPEVLLMVKCTDAQRHAMKMVWADMHPYELPELLFVKADDGHAPYLDWIRGV